VITDASSGLGGEHRCGTHRHFRGVRRVHVDRSTDGPLIDTDRKDHDGGSQPGVEAGGPWR
jgi:hypothetical protein